jgi:O-antigen ligase
VLITALVAFVLLLSFSGNILHFVEQIAPSITEGTDTMGLRYALWDAGFKMWMDHPITGVGIGMFPPTLRYYPNSTYPMFFSRGLVAHNMYVSMLAETGIIGFLLFMGLLFTPLVSLLKRRRYLDSDFRNIATVRIIVFIVLLVGGMTKTDQVDKVVWLTLGMLTFLSIRSKTRQKELSAQTTQANGESPKGKTPA